MKYGELTLGQVEAIVNNLGGMGGVKRFLSGESAVKKTECTFGIRETIKLGDLKTAEEFREALKNEGFKISDWVNDTIGKSAGTEVDLVMVTVGELGLWEGAREEEIYKRAKEFGLELCSVEVGLQLRLQYKDQPDGEWVLIGIEPITGSVNSLRVFAMGHSNSELWLCSYWGTPDGICFPDGVCSPNVKWVFCYPRPRK